MLVKSIIAFMNHGLYMHAKSVQVDNNIIKVFSSVISLTVIIAIAASATFRQSFDHVAVMPCQWAICEGHISRTRFLP